ncbi:hypothetical protein ACV229_27150 [Burkholderia sp. MR1-5-21]
MERPEIRECEQRQDPLQALSSKADLDFVPEPHVAVRDATVTCHGGRLDERQRGPAISQPHAAKIDGGKQPGSHDFK